MRIRLFLTCWIVFSLHFATNVVREHYPAFSLIETGSFRVDEYEGMHADIFRHSDGHCYIGNQVMGSVIAAVPLLVFDPLLDWLEDYRLIQIKEDGTPPAGSYQTDRPSRRAFYQAVVDRGLDLRFGAATVVTSVFLMAPVTSWLVVMMFSTLRRRGLNASRSLWLALLLAFGTPVFFRSAVLNHNMFFTIAVFGSFLLLWPQQGDDSISSVSQRAGAGFLAGLSLALDYAAVIFLPALLAYLLWTQWKKNDLSGTFRAIVPFVVGVIPPAAFLLYSQWAMYGHPIWPGQYWMKNTNLYVGEGLRGFTLPDLDLFLHNLFDLDWGLFAFGPLLLLSLLPARIYRRGHLILPRRERRFVALLSLSFMLFCAANQYSRLQWNTGFRYLLPLVPFAYLALSDHLARLKKWSLAAVSLVVVTHSWVLAMVRYTPGIRAEPHAVIENWRRFLDQGLQFPWLEVLKSTPSLGWSWIHFPSTPLVLVSITALSLVLVWTLPGFHIGSAEPTKEDR